MSEFRLRRLGVVMEPEPGNPLEADGVLNPAAARGPDGQLYLFPRLTARGNYSRIGIADVYKRQARNADWGIFQASLWRCAAKITSGAMRRATW